MNDIIGRAITVLIIMFSMLIKAKQDPNLQGNPNPHALPPTLCTSRFNALLGIKTEYFEKRIPLMFMLTNLWTKVMVEASKQLRRDVQRKQGCFLESLSVLFLWNYSSQVLI